MRVLGKLWSAGFVPTYMIDVIYLHFLYVGFFVLNICRRYLFFAWLYDRWRNSTFFIHIHFSCLVLNIYIMYC